MTKRHTGIVAALVAVSAAIGVGLDHEGVVFNGNGSPKTTRSQGNVSQGQATALNGVVINGNNNAVESGAIGAQPTSGQPTSAPPPASSGAYKSRFVRDATLPDGTLVAPGSRHIKTWVIENVGSIAWRGLTLRRVSPREASNVGAIPVPLTIPGRTVTLSVPLTAPASRGMIRENWALFRGRHRIFKPGSEMYFAVVVT